MTLAHAPGALNVRAHAGPSTLTRYAGFAAAWVLFITVARLIVPQASSAADNPPDSAIPRPPSPPAATAARPAAHDIGSFVNSEYIVRAYATTDGPRFSVWTLDGDVLGQDLDARALAEAFPSLDTAAKSAEQPRLMSADDGR